MDTTIDRKLTTALGEHLIVLLVVAAVIIASLGAVPSLMTKTSGTAVQMEERMYAPLTADAELDVAP
jgi:hypothetical protein